MALCSKAFSCRGGTAVVSGSGRLLLMAGLDVSSGYCMLSTKSTPLWSNSTLKETYGLELPLSGGPTKFPLISCTFPQRIEVMKQRFLSSNTALPKFVLKNEFLLLK